MGRFSTVEKCNKCKIYNKEPRRGVCQRCRNDRDRELYLKKKLESMSCPAFEGPIVGFSKEQVAELKKNYGTLTTATSNDTNSDYTHISLKTPKSLTESEQAITRCKQKRPGCKVSVSSQSDGRLIRIRVYNA